MTKTQAEMILSLKGEYSPADVKQRYRKLSKISHPDQNGDEDLFALIKEAYEVLKDESGFVKEETKPAKKSKTKNAKEEKTPVSERDKIISSCEKIEFDVHDFLVLASGYSIKRTYLYRGKEKEVEFKLQDFVMNYYKNIFLVFDFEIEYDEVAFFSKENVKLGVRKISTLASDNIIASYGPQITTSKNRKIMLRYKMFDSYTDVVIERSENSKMSIHEFSVKETEYGTIRIKCIVNTHCKRE